MVHWWDLQWDTASLIELIRNSNFLQRMEKLKRRCWLFALWQNTFYNTLVEGEKSTQLWSLHWVASNNLCFLVFTTLCRFLPHGLCDWPCDLPWPVKTDKQRLILLEGMLVLGGFGHHMWRSLYILHLSQSSQKRHQTCEWQSHIGCSSLSRHPWNRTAVQISSAQIAEQ